MCREHSLNEASSRRRSTTALAAALGLLLTLVPATSAIAQDTREAQIRQEREQKSKQVQPVRRGKVERALLKMEEDLLVPRIFNSPRGLFVRAGSITEGSGLAGGPAFRLSNARVSFTVSGAASVKKYWIADARLAFTPSDWFFADVYARRMESPQEDFFGLGPGSRSTDRTSFTLRDTTGSVTAGVRPVSSLAIGGRVEYVMPRIGEGKDPRHPTIQQRFSDLQAPGLLAQPDFLRYEAFLDFDYRDLEARSGGRYLVSFSKYDDRDLKRFSFRRLDVEAQQLIPIVKSHRTLALRAIVSVSDPDSGHQIPFYLQRTLGGGSTLRGFKMQRFRDHNLMLLQAEYRFLVNRFVTGALFYDAGKVTRDTDDLDFDRLERDYGFGLRMGSLGGLVAIRFDVAFGSGEGVRYLLRFNDVF